MTNLTNSKILIICGPTSSGKTALALRFAEVLMKAGRPTSIISADSRQVYRGLTILTGKDIPPDSPVHFYGLDLCDPDETFSAAEYSDRMRAIIDNETKENRQVIIVGGTGFYLSALTDPASLAKVPPDEKLRQELDRLSVEELQRKLNEINPKKLNSMNRSDISNPRRLIRAIEVASSPAGSVPAETSPSVIPTEVEESLSFVWVGLKLPLSEIKEKITARIDSRLTAAVDEVKTLLATYPDKSLPIYTSLGVKPILRYLAGEVTGQQLRELWITDEVNYAKRQLTWFKKQKQIIWYDLNSIRQAKLDQLL